MRHHMGRGPRTRWLWATAAFLAAVGGAAPLCGQAPVGAPTGLTVGTAPVVVQVEEDWELVVATPDPDSAGPQVTCVFSPTGSLGSLHAAFELNQRSQPSFAPGGLQLQVWSGESLMGQTQSPDAALMRTSGETVRWTQRMKLVEGGVLFEIVDGASTTWGAFGGQGYLKAAVGSGLANLAGYDPAVSVANSGVGFAGNRVRSLALLRVRYVTADGQTLEDNNPRNVHSPE